MKVGEDYLSYATISQKFSPEMREIWNVKELIECAAQSRLYGEKVYFTFAPTGQQYTYQETNRFANRIAHSLAAIGLKKGDRVGIYMSNKPEYVFSLFALAKSGLIEVPINIHLQADEVAYIINKAEISTLIVESKDAFLKVLNEVVKKTPSLKHVIVDGEPFAINSSSVHLHSLQNIMEWAHDTNPQVSIDGADLYSIMFTSGTTGLPKGAMMSHQTTVLAAKSVASIPVDSASRNYNCLPLFHTNAQVYSLLGMACLGGSVVLSDRFSPRKFWDEIITYQANFFNAIGSILQILDAAFEADQVPDHPVQMVMVGGTPVELWKRFESKFNLDIYEGFAMTEAPVLFHNCHPDKEKRKIGSCGKPLFWDLGRQVKLVNDQNEEVTVGTGELWQRGPGFITQGYWNAPEANKENFDEEGWFRTGDILRVDEDGYYYFVDRKKFMIRVGGENVSAFEVEEVVNSHPSVAESAAIPVDDPYKGEEIKVFIRPVEGIHQLDFVEMVKWCAKKLAYFKVPRYFELVAELPKTPTQRIQKNLLKVQERGKQDHGWDRNQEFPDWRTLYP